ncbi:hypothetical protein GCM10027615_47120 [Plantactinospora veratri]
MFQPVEEYCRAEVRGVCEHLADKSTRLVRPPLAKQGGGKRDLGESTATYVTVLATCEGLV